MNAPPLACGRILAIEIEPFGFRRLTPPVSQSLTDFQNTRFQRHGEALPAQRNRRKEIMRAIEINLDELIAGQMGRGDAEERNKPLPIYEAQVATLKELCDRYTAGCPFKVGDLVTPRKGSIYRGRGLPHIVLDVPAQPHHHFSKENTGVQDFGARMDVRVACFVPDGSVLLYWMESHWLEPWDEAKANAK